MPGPAEEPQRQDQQQADPAPTPEQAGFEVLIMPAGRFELGRLVATPGALAALDKAGVSPVELVARHWSGDWGDLDSEDKAANNRALVDGERLLSSYDLPGTGEKVWVITEWDRSATTLLLPSDY